MTPTNLLPNSVDRESISTTLLDNMTTAVVALDSELKFTALNTAAEQLFGISWHKAIGRPLSQIVLIPDSLFARLRGAVELDQPVNDRHVTIEPIGRESILVDCSVAPFLDESNNDGLLIELTALDRSLRIARDAALATQQENVKSLVRNLAHEIKNPLGGLRGAAQLLERQLNDKEQIEYTSIIIQEADRLKTLIDRLLGPNSKPRRDELNIHEVLEHVRKISMVGTSSNVSLTFDYDPSIPEFLSDRDRLVQVFLNIAGNALQAVGNEGEVLFKTRVETNFTIASKLHPLVIIVSIRNNGPGIPEQLLSQIFYPMVSLRSGGSGLGLSIAQSIMSQLGGLVECRSEPNETEFSVLIPVELT